MKKRFIVFLVVLTLCSFMFANGQSETADAAGAKPVIRCLLPANEQQIANYDAYFAEIEKELNVDIEPDYVGNWDEVNQKFLTQLAAGTPPDIMDLAVMYKDQFMRAGYMYDITEFAEKDGFEFDLYYPAQIDTFRFDGGLYAFPNGCTSISIYYNKDMFREAGIELPSSDWMAAMNWQEFYEAAKALTSGSGVTKKYGVATTYEIGWLLPFFWQHNARFISEDGTKCAINTPEGIETLQYIYDLMFAEELSPSVSSMKTIGPADLFKSGKLAMFIDGNWWMPYFQDCDGFDWGVMPLPQDERVVTGFYIDGWGVTKDSKNPELAYQVLRRMVSKAGIAHGITKGTPPMIEMAEQQIAEIYNFVDEDSRATWAGALGVGQTPTYTKNWAQLVSETNKVLERMSLGLVSPADAAAEIEAKVNPLLK